MVITRDKKGSPDMILTAFDGKFHEEKDEIPPSACRASKKLKTNNVEQVDIQKVNKKNYVEKVGSYTLIYFHIPSHTLKS